MTSETTSLPAASLSCSEGTAPAASPKGGLAAKLQDLSLRSRLGQQAEAGRDAAFFSMTRRMEDWLDLISSFEAFFPLRATPGS